MKSPLHIAIPFACVLAGCYASSRMEFDTHQDPPAISGRETWIQILTGDDYGLPVSIIESTSGDFTVLGAKTPQRFFGGDWGLFSNIFALNKKARPG
ncbi:MAG: hypothetical protein ABIJ56_12325 [Pseudomonadota bacterium]